MLNHEENRKGCVVRVNRVENHCSKGERVRLTDGDDIVEFKKENNIIKQGVLLLFIHSSNSGDVSFGSIIGFKPNSSERNSIVVQRKREE